MNNDAQKKKNTAIFIALATLGNIVLMIILFIIGFVLLAKFGNPEDESGNMVWVTAIFFISIGLSWFIYSRFIKWYTKKVNTNETFAPIFSSKRKPNSDYSKMNKTNMKE